MYVLHDTSQIRIFVDMFCAEGFYEKPSDSLLPDIEIHRIRGSDFLHESRNAIISNFVEEKMEMCRHDAIRTDRDQGLSTRVRINIFARHPWKVVTTHWPFAVAEVERLQESFVITIRLKCDAFFDRARITVIPFTRREYCLSRSHSR